MVRYLDRFLIITFVESPQSLWMACHKLSFPARVDLEGKDLEAWVGWGRLNRLALTTEHFVKSCNKCRVCAHCYKSLQCHFYTIFTDLETGQKGLQKSAAQCYQRFCLCANKEEQEASTGSGQLLTAADRSKKGLQLSASRVQGPMISRIQRRKIYSKIL